jgi:putative heme-binding domain-containing protein
MFSISLLSVALCWTADAQTTAQAAAKADLQAFSVAEGYEVQLYAADPAIAKPIQMNFDARGRLWLVTSRSYPQLKPGAEPEDAVYVLEDADGDGKAEKATCFADGLLIPTGIEIGAGGVYVGQSTDFLHLADTNGDGKADQRRVLLSGFGTEDTHHLIHSFRWGPGGLLYFAQAIYTHSHVETPWGVRRMDGGGYWHLRPESMQLETFVRGMTNSWGAAFDDYGQAIGVDNDGSSLNYFFPGARLRRTPGESLNAPLIIDGKPKYCGVEYLSGRQIAEADRGRLVCCDFRAHRVCRYDVKEAGAGYAPREVDPLITSTNTAFRPVDVKMGPDGAVYVCDWYNPIINHGEVDFRDPRRDRTHGRIWRIVHKSNKLIPRPKLEDASTTALLEAQKAPEGWTRHFAYRVLAERPKAGVLPELDEWTGKQTDELVLLRALWLYQALDAPNGDLLYRLLDAKDGRIRAAAVRVLSHWNNRIANPIALLSRRIHDEHPRVRLEAIRALAQFHTAEATAIALTALDQPTDPFLDYALKLTARETADAWLDRALKSTDPREAARWVFALEALDSPASARPLVVLYSSNLVPANRRSAVLNVIAKQGDSWSLGYVLGAVAKSRDPKERTSLLGAVSEAHRLRQAVPDGNLSTTLKPLLADSHAEVRSAAAALVGAWKVKELSPALQTLATKDADRAAAVAAIGALGSAEDVQFLEKAASEADSPVARGQILAALAPHALDKVVAIAKTSLLTAEKPADAAPVLDAVLPQQQGPAALAKALSGASLKKPIAEEAVRRLRATGRPAPELIAALSKAGGLPDSMREPSVVELNRLAKLTLEQGDASRGEQIFKREKLNCVKCHLVRGVGGKVGPDLTTIGASAPVDYLLESLLAPNKKVKENYHALIVVTEDGRVLTGIPEKSTDAEVVLRTAEDKLISIPKREIESSKQGASLMPTGLMEDLTSGELLDLARYLSELGKPGPYGLGVEKTAKVWHLLGPVRASEVEPTTKRILAEGPDLRTDSVEWQRSLVTNAGWVYLREFALKPDMKGVFATLLIHADKPGKVRLSLEPGRSALAWLDGKPMKADKFDAIFDVALPARPVRLLVRVDLTSHPNFLKLRAFPLDAGVTFEFAEKP